MKTNWLILVMAILLAAAFYFLGKKNGEGQMKAEIVQNVSIIKEIAQLATLEVNGQTKIKMTNKQSESGFWNKFKNYFTENTLQVELPYEAKFGVDMRNQKVDVDTKAGVVTLTLPPCKLLSLQLRLDKLQSMSQAGIFNTVTISDFMRAQKELYATASASLENNTGYLRLAEDNIRNTLGKYYAPLGYKVVVKFTGKEAELP
jgi:hypothetical protein